EDRRGLAEEQPVMNGELDVGALRVEAIERDEPVRRDTARALVHLELREAKARGIAGELEPDVAPAAIGVRHGERAAMDRERAGDLRRLELVAVERERGIHVPVERARVGAIEIARELRGDELRERNRRRGDVRVDRRTGAGACELGGDRDAVAMNLDI